MREHPIPQDITGYRFHIIGNMTLKQFGELALGVILAVVTYATNLPLIIKLPFIVIFILLGVIAAFIPIAERPLDHWLLTFFRVLYRPTLYFWQKSDHIPPAFTYKSTQTITYEPELDLSPARRQRIKEYISSVSYALPEDTQFEPGEATHLQTIMAQFDSVTVTQTSSTPTSEKPVLDVRVRSMRVSEETLDNLPVTPISAHLSKTQPAATVFIDANLVANPADTNKQILNTDQVAQEIQIPDIQTMTMGTTVLAQDDTPMLTSAVVDTQRSYSNYQNTSIQDTSGTMQGTQYNTNLPFPQMPTVPNKPVGMVLSTTNDLITGAIIEIKTQDGVIARAVKTNALGQFFVTTPLNEGNYVIETKKDGYTFPSQTLVLTDQPVSPIEIRGTALQN